MDIKKSRIITGLWYLLSTVLTVYAAYTAYLFATVSGTSASPTSAMTGFMVGYPVWIVAFGLTALFQLHYSLFYLLKKPRVRSFYVVSVVYSLFDLVSMALFIRLTVLAFTTAADARFKLIFLAAAVVLAVLVILKLFCSVVFHSESEDEWGEGNPSATRA